MRFDRRFEHERRVRLAVHPRAAPTGPPDGVVRRGHGRGCRAGVPGQPSLGPPASRAQRQCVEPHRDPSRRANARRPEGEGRPPRTGTRSRRRRVGGVIMGALLRSVRHQARGARMVARGLGMVSRCRRLHARGVQAALSLRRGSGPGHHPAVGDDPLVVQREVLERLPLRRSARCDRPLDRLGDDLGDWRRGRARRDRAPSTSPPMPVSEVVTISQPCPRPSWIGCPICSFQKPARCERRRSVPLDRIARWMSARGRVDVDGHRWLVGRPRL